MILLALELSSTQRSAALGRRAGPEAAVEVLGQVSEAGGRSSRPLVLIDRLLQQTSVDRAALSGLIVGLGPGSYTGIRSALALAQGWQLARHIPVSGVSTVECLAAQAHAAELFGEIHIAIDAQRSEFYVAGYEVQPGGWQLRAPLRLATREEVVAIAERQEALLVGPDVGQLSPKARLLFPEARTLFRCAPHLADASGAEHLAPIYLRETSFVKAPPPRRIE